MKLLLDEMYPPEIARGLRDRGHDAVAVAERSADRGKGDIQVLALAIAEGRVLVTNNHKHYVPVFTRMAPDGDHPGLLLTSDRSLPRRKRGIGGLVRMLDRFLGEHPSDDALRNALRWLS